MGRLTDPMHAGVVRLLWCLACLAAAASSKQMRKVDPVALGHERMVNLSGVVRSMKTLALDPPVFLISQFLTPAEADGIVRAGTAKGLGKSQVAHPSANGISLPPHHAQFKGAFSRHDQNRDGALDSDELAVFLSDEMDMPNHAGEWDTFLQRYSLTGSKVSFKTFKTKGIDLGKYVTWLTNLKPHLRQRYSNQAWLHYDLAATSILKERAAAVTLLPSRIIQSAEDLQVLRYSSGGHYACHHDSSPDLLEEGESVRLATIALFLNEPASGGEIAFPAADHPESASYGEEEWSDMESRCQPTSQCIQMGGVVVKPRKGDAVFWYNMKVEKWSEDGSQVPGAEALYWNSMHCGAEVKEGEKWMANMWLQSALSDDVADEDEM